MPPAALADTREDSEERVMADLECRVENRVGTILLNRPEKRNAFTLEMLHRWAEA